MEKHCIFPQTIRIQIAIDHTRESVSGIRSLRSTIRFDGGQFAIQHQGSLSNAYTWHLSPHWDQRRPDRGTRWVCFPREDYQCHKKHIESTPTSAFARVVSSGSKCSSRPSVVDSLICTYSQPYITKLTEKYTNPIPTAQGTDSVLAQRFLLPLAAAGMASMIGMTSLSRFLPSNEKY